jgi:hypothetical protein
MLQLDLVELIRQAKSTLAQAEKTLRAAEEYLRARS